MKITNEMLRKNAPQARDLWLDTLPQKGEVPVFTVSSQFEEKMNYLLQKNHRIEKRKSYLRSLRGVAAVLLVLSVVSFVGLITVSASFRERVIQVVSRVFSDHTQYNYSSTQEGAMLPELHLNSLPEGFTVLSDERFEQLSRQIHCENDAGYYLDIDVYAISFNDVATQLLDTEGAKVAVMDIQGREVTVVSKDGRIILSWVEDSSVLSLSSNVELPELTPIVERLTDKP